ncbi:glycosyltransferase [Miltoncostaea marina]|uniref:glycosyltransferase n=1 Tax=Miltoncostaea marina TaxID=2843215 RepID=UPI001C3C50C8|nr:glycosyltransferase [Miltoncostaea marina]
MLGTRGIPAAYSGFETAVEHLAGRFSARGHEVTVYCRPHMTERRATHAGARLVHLPTVRSKHLDTLAHTLVSTVHMATRARPDVALYFIAGNAPGAALARLAGVPSVLQIDGLDSERAKWSGPAKAYLRLAERLAPAAATIAVTDSAAVADAYERRYGRRIPWIPYGAEMPDPGDAGQCARLGLEPGRFVLFVGRLVPENNAHLLVEAHRRLGTDWPLVVVGDAPYAEDYIARLRAAAGPDVRFPGYVFGDGYRELVHRCGVMCAPTEVGGTHPVIVEAMAAGAPLLVSDHAPNLEVVGDAAATFPLTGRAGALAEALGALIGDGARRTDLGGRAAARAAERYSWDACADAYLRLCEVVAGRQPA